nr:DUF4203 domain-containing protein [Salsipaludibacter albus]
MAVLVGAAFCFRGYLAMRVIIPMWGALVGFFLGAGLVASFTDGGFLATTTAWLVGVGVALLFGVLAYLYYEFSVVLSMAAIGWVLGTTVLVALGVTWTWVIILGGVAAGALLGFVAIAADLPMALLTILTAFGGATVVTTGVMLLVGTLDVEQLGQGATTVAMETSAWWVVLYFGLAIAGIVIQLRDVDRRRAGLRSAWEGDGGRSMRAV